MKKFNVLEFVKIAPVLDIPFFVLVTEDIGGLIMVVSYGI